MNCKYCQMPLEDGAMFCSYCGQRQDGPDPVAAPVEPAVAVDPYAAPVASMEPAAPADPYATPDSYAASAVDEYGQPIMYADGSTPMTQPPAPSAPAKKNMKPLIIAGCIVGGVAILALLVILLWNPIMSATPAQTQFKYVYGKTLAEVTVEATDAAGQSMDLVAGSSSLEGSATVMISDDMLSNYNMQGLGEVKVEYAYGANEESAIGMDFAVSCGSTEIATLNAYMDMENGKMLMAVPGLTDEILLMDLEEMGVSTTEEYDAIAEYADELVDIFAEAIGSVAPAILDEALAQIDNVQREKTSFTAGSVSQEATCLSLEITEKMVAEIVAAALEEVRDSKDVKNCLYDFYEIACEIPEIDMRSQFYSAEEFYAEFQRAVDDGIEETRYVDGYETVAVWKTWVSGKNEILAVSVIVPTESMELFAGCAENDDNVCFELRVQETYHVLMSVQAFGTTSGNKFTGDLKVSYEGAEVLDVDCVDVDLSALKDARLKGEFTIVPTEAMIDAMGEEIRYGTIAAKVDISAKKMDVQADVLMNNALVGSVTLENSIGGKYNAKAPEGITESDPQTWISGIDLAELRNRLAEAGFPSEMLAAMDEATGYYL